jgi:hypothetical protein
VQVLVLARVLERLRALEPEQLRARLLVPVQVQVRKQPVPGLEPAPWSCSAKIRPIRRHRRLRGRKRPAGT